MVRLSSYFTALVTLSVAFASPVVEIKDNLVTLPIVKKINSIGAKNFVANEQARAAHLVALGRERAAARQARARGEEVKRSIVGSVPVSNQVVSYIATVGVGSPATDFDLIVDTGSSNTWVGAGKAFVKTSTSVSTGNRVAVTYGSGSFSGTEFTDTVTLSSSLVITKQSIGVASTSTGFDGVDGIIGIGPTDLTEDTVAKTSTVPTVTDNLFSQKTTSAHSVAVSFEPTTSDAVTNGELTFGGTDSSKFTGSITFVPITSTSPASEFWGINESINFGGTNILSSTAGIVDTGTTLILIATNAFSAYEKATGAVLDNTTGLLRVTTAQFNALKNLNFVIGGVTFALTPNAQIFPRSLNAEIGGVAGDIYLIVNSIGTPSGEGLDFINGYAFLERFYSVFDTANSRVGLATTSFTGATTN